MERIKTRGTAQGFKCSECLKGGHDCVTSPDSLYCLQCNKTGRTCKWDPSLSSDFAKIDKEKERLRREEVEEEERMEASFLKIRRLRKLKRFLEGREAKMIQLGLQNVEELEKLEQEEEEAKGRERAASSTVAESLLAVGSPGFGEAEALSPGAWERLLAEPAFLGIGEGEPGSSSGWLPVPMCCLLLDNSSI